MPTKSSAPKGLPVKSKIRKELIISYHTFHRGTGEQYIKLLEDFESIVHKKGLRTIFQKLDANRIARQADLDLHLGTRPNKQERKNPLNKMDVDPSAGLS